MQNIRGPGFEHFKEIKVFSVTKVDFMKQGLYEHRKIVTLLGSLNPWYICVGH